MIKHDLNTFFKGWVIGNFIPSLYKNDLVEVSVKKFFMGEIEPRHKQIIATELTIVVAGQIRMNNFFYSENDIIEILPGESADFEAITDSTLVCIKFPSIPDDKVLI